MTQQFDNTNRGVLFINNKKAEGSNQPDRTGSLNVDGVEYFLDGWMKKSQAGQPFLSVSIKRKDKQPEPQKAPQAEQKALPKEAERFADMDDDTIPF